VVLALGNVDSTPGPSGHAEQATAATGPKQDAVEERLRVYGVQPVRSDDEVNRAVGGRLPAQQTGRLDHAPAGVQRSTVDLAGPSVLLDPLRKASIDVWAVGEHASGPFVVDQHDPGFREIPPEFPEYWAEQDGVAKVVPVHDRHVAQFRERSGTAAGHPVEAREYKASREPPDGTTHPGGPRHGVRHL